MSHQRSDICIQPSAEWTCRNSDVVASCWHICSHVDSLKWTVTTGLCPYHPIWENTGLPRSVLQSIGLLLVLVCLCITVRTVGELHWLSLAVKSMGETSAEQLLHFKSLSSSLQCFSCHKRSPQKLHVDRYGLFCCLELDVQCNM